MNKKLDPQKHSRLHNFAIGESVPLAIEGYLMQCVYERNVMFSGTFGDFVVRYKVEWVDEHEKSFDMVEAEVYVNDQFFVKAEYDRLVRTDIIYDMNDARYEPLIVEFELTPRDGGLKQWTGTILN